MARNGTEQVRQLQRTLYRTSKQSKAVKFYSLQGVAYRRTPRGLGTSQSQCVAWRRRVDAQPIAAGTTRQYLPFSTCAEGRHSKPKGGTRPLGIATVEDRVVQTAMKLVSELR